MMATHEDWQAARDQRDRLARKAVSHLLAGDIEAAMTCARLSDAADDDMQRIANVLDGKR